MGAEDPEEDGPATVASPLGRAAKSRSQPGPEGTPGARLAAGERVGRYLIEEVMAEGGMGVVYLAHDPELDRKVAIKLIRPGDEAENLEGGARLLREAQAMARLSHPNVVVVHDVGSVGKSVFLAMEYVRGQTLRRWLIDAPRSWREILDAFLAAGRGLAAAHDVDIVHRDFKPDNVLVRHDGRVLVTDFGLARDTTVEELHASGSRRQPAAGLLGLSVTVTGDLVGTPLYMAPEQHRRDPTDARTDQFSFAVALFAALCERHPFGDPKHPDFLNRVVDGRAEPSAAHLPARVRRALARALESSPDKRFPTLGALLAELDVGRSHRRTWVIAGVVALAIAAAAVFVFTRGESRTPLRVSRTTPITRDADLQLDPSPSPDGQRLAYASGQLGHMRIYVRGETGLAIPLTADLPGDHRWPQWSRDGSQIIFQAAEAGFESRYRIYTVPASGGTPRVLVAPPGKSVAMPAWSPDGRSIAYVQFAQDWNPPWDIVVSNADGTNARNLVSIERHVTLSTPAWSPDGTHVAYSHGNLSFYLRGNIAPASIWVVPVDGGPPLQVTSGPSLDHAPVWTRDGRMLFVSDRDGTPDIYELAVDSRGAPLGAPARITAGLHAHTLAIAADNRLVCSVFSYRTNLWSVPIPAPDVEGSLANAQAITTGNQIIESVDPSPDGRSLLFDSNRSGNQDIYVMPAEGGEPTALTTDPANDFAPSWSSDGRYITFHSFRTGTRNVFIADHDGRNPKQITHGTFNHWNPRFSPDGKTLVFYSDRGGDWDIWSAPVEGGPPRQLTFIKAVAARWSPDGKTLGFTNREGLWTMPAGGGTPHHLVVATEVKNHNWSRDGSIIYYRRHDWGSAIWAVPSSGGTPRRVLRLDDPSRHPDRVEFGVDDRRFLIPLTEHDADLWTLELGP